MAIINKKGTYLVMPQSFKRNNAIPLDLTSVWYDYSSMEAYAQSNVTAYVGQILTLVEEENNTASLYVIKDSTGALKKIEGGEAELTFKTDEKSISVINNELSLANYGIKYYKWIVEEDGTGNYALQEVNEENPWKEGLEPRVALSEDNELEIGWFEPSTSTIEGLTSTVEALENKVENILVQIGEQENFEPIFTEIKNIKAKNEEQDISILNALPLSGGELTGELILADKSKAASEAFVSTQIASAIGELDHLRREIVSVLPNVENAKTNVVYMVKKAESEEYVEYLFVDGKFELIGDTSVDLTNYLKKVENFVAGNFVNFAEDGSLLDSGFKSTDFVPASHLKGFVSHVTNEERALWNNKVDKEDGKLLVSAEEVARLSKMASIFSVSTGLILEPNTGILSAAVANETTAGILTPELFSKINNSISGALLGNEEAVIENNLLQIPVANENNFGVVKSSSADNKILVNTDGTMAINRVATNKLYVPQGDELILCGGNAE